MEDLVGAAIAILLITAVLAAFIVPVALFARAKGRDPFIWAGLCILISPLLAFGLLVILPRVNGGGRPPAAPA
jgi:hypothetical protein